VGLAVLTLPLSAVAQVDDAPPDSKALLTQAQDLARRSAADRDTAERLYRRLLELPSRWQHPAAQIGLAELARVRGELGESFTLLVLAKRDLDFQADYVKAQSGEGAQAALRYLQWVRTLWHFELGRSQLAMGLVDQADQQMERQWEIAKEGGPLDRLAGAEARIDLALARGDYRRARLRAEQALADQARVLAELQPNDPQGKETALRLAAVGSGLEFRRLCAQVRASGNAEELVRTARAFDELLTAAHLDVALRRRAEIECAGAWLRSGDLVEATDRAEVLADRVSGEPLLSAESLAMQARIAMATGSSGAALRPVRDGLVGAVDRLFAAWASLPLREGGIGSFQFDGRRDVLSTMLRLEREVGSADAAACAFGHLERALALGTLSRRLGARAVDSAALPSELPPGGGVLACFFAPSGGHVFAIDASGAVHVEFAVDPDFDAGLDELHRGVVMPPQGDGVAAVRRMREVGGLVAARLLPEPVRARLGRWQQMVVIGEQVPPAVWHALPWADSWLCLHLPIRHVPSAALARRLRERHAQRVSDGERLDLAVIGAPAHDPAYIERGLSPLQLTSTDRRTLLGDSPGSRGWFGAAAQWSVFDLPEVRAARAVCVLAHGVQDFQRERFAGVLLSPPAKGSAVVFADVIERVPLPPLMVLGTCGAADGPQRFGDDGVAHLGGACLMGGADAVVLAGGALSLGASVDLFGALFAELRAGRALSEALWRARRQISARPERAHPYFFAGLRHLGAEVAWR
jgi:hypothetical protein